MTEPALTEGQDGLTTEALDPGHTALLHPCTPAGQGTETPSNRGFTPRRTIHPHQGGPKPGQSQPRAPLGPADDRHFRRPLLWGHRGLDTPRYACPPLGRPGGHQTWRKPFPRPRP